jgi:hypothetical protein
MKVICIKMNSGEDLIARLVAYNLTEADPLAVEPWSLPQGEVTLESIRAISLQPISRSEMGVSLIPYLLADADAPFKVDLARVAVGIYKGGYDLEESYLRQTSPLQVAPSAPKIQLS